MIDLSGFTNEIASNPPLYQIALPGCRSQPLASYLKTLGILRIIAEQKDETCCGHWQQDMFVLTTLHPPEALIHFFLEEYQPTPIVAPWNGGSGFYPKDRQVAVHAIQQSQAPRFARYKSLIDETFRLLKRLNLNEKPSEHKKRLLIRKIRSSFPHDFLKWLDAAVYLTESDPKYPPLLGTGGNDGRLEFTNNFMQRLLQLFDPQTGAPTAHARSWLIESLWEQQVTPLVSASFGQFAPGAVGGPNATTGFERDSLTNPWDFVLMLEGALLFAAAATRRFESHASEALSYPFTVKAVPAGYGSLHDVDENKARAELWFPLWSRPASLTELKFLFAEGRATLGRRPVVNGLDFARAVARLGVDRGINRFQRFGLFERSGRSYIATPIGTIHVRHHPHSRLIDNLDQNDFLRRLHRVASGAEISGAFRALVHRLDQSLFQLTQRQPIHPLVQQILVILGQLHQVIAKSEKLRDHVPPVPPLDPRWLRYADDRSDEFQLALALTSLTGPAPFLHHLTPILPRTTRKSWDDRANPIFSWTSGDVITNLRQTVRNRWLFLYEKFENSNKRFDEREAPSSTHRYHLGHDLPFDARVPVSAPSLLRFVRHQINDRRLIRLIPALALIDLDGYRPPSMEGPDRIPAGLILLKLLFTPRRVLYQTGLWSPDRRPPSPERTLALLTANRISDAIREAWRGLRLSGLVRLSYPIKEPHWSPPEPRRVLAAMIFPLGYRVLERNGHHFSAEKMQPYHTLS